jgi:Rhodopirellula transposase DDE domain
MDPKLKRAVPYGVYDVNYNVGWVSVGTDSDTASFAVNAIRRWWRVMGRKRYPEAKRLLPITVCHLPPGTSKWNKVEHRLFSFRIGVASRCAAIGQSSS